MVFAMRGPEFRNDVLLFFCKNFHQPESVNSEIRRLHPINTLLRGSLVGTTKTRHFVHVPVSLSTRRMKNTRKNDDNKHDFVEDELYFFLFPSHRGGNGKTRVIYNDSAQNRIPSAIHRHMQIRNEFQSIVRLPRRLRIYDSGARPFFLFRRDNSQRRSFIFRLGEFISPLGTDKRK